MKCLKLFLAFILSTLYFVLCTAPARAENEFSVDVNVTYKIEDSGKTLVTHDITLENNFSTLYATTYTVMLENIDAQNIRAYSVEDAAYSLDTSKNGDKTNVKINFSDPVVGKSAKRHFFVSYENGSFATRTGEVWEISIPKLADKESFRSYDVNLMIPPSFGQEAYVSPSPRSIGAEEGYKTYSFSKSDVSATGITAGFGAFQVFNFNLSYHLENPVPKSSDVEIALPPDTAFQKVYLQDITPKPLNVRVDSDGNWLALYRLTGRQRVDVNVRGSVQIFSGFRAFPYPSQETLDANLKPAEFWETEDPRIIKLADELKTPKAIYDYIVKTLKYDYSRVRSNVERLGASGALSSPETAICMEFTDLFIAIARAAGIPAREINGYAYTENPKIQPLSLVADVLHAWPEYYDKDKKAWIPIDPTWGSTTGGVDFFNKLDLRHFTFVIHGVDSVKPYAAGSYKLGTNPQKDVFVSFGSLSEVRFSSVQILGEFSQNIPFVNSKVVAKIINPGPVAVYNMNSRVYFDGSLNQSSTIEVLPPYSSSSLRLVVPFSILGTKTPDVVKITAASAELSLKTNKTKVVIEGLLFLAILLFIVLISLLIRLKRIKINFITTIIDSLKSKIAGYGKKPKEPAPPQPES